MQNALLTAAISALLATSSVAFARSDISFSKDGKLAFAAPHASPSFLHYVPKPKAVTIYSNLASDYPKGLYFAGEGETIYASGGNSQFVAGGFTPTASTKAVEVQVAVGNFGDGNSTYTLSINADASGVPGTALASKVITSTNTFGECCGVVSVKFPAGVALAANTPYWVVVSLTARQEKDMDDGAWNLATTDQVDDAPFAFNPNNSGWVAYGTTQPPAFGVFSK